MITNWENAFTYQPMSYDIIFHTLTLGYAVMLAALFYFVLTIRTVAPRYRISSILSVVVMVSAFLILFAQSASWNNAFVFDSAQGLYVRNSEAVAFSNGFRYLNWLIDVPMLLFQILFVVEISASQRNSLRNWFFFSGAMMIVTGYVGQFYEADANNQAAFLIWGTISTAFFVHVLYLMYRLITNSLPGLPQTARPVMMSIWWLFLVSWMLYPGAYLMPLLLNSEAGVVGRQLTFTVADITSKVFYGVLLTTVAQIRSEAEGFVSDSPMITRPATGD